MIIVNNPRYYIRKNNGKSANFHYSALELHNNHYKDNYYDSHR